jgi:hypothetical protein
MARTVIAVVLLVVAAGTIYSIATRQVFTPPSVPPSAESSPNDAASTDAAEISSSSESLLDATSSDEERIAAIKQTMARSMAQSRDLYAARLAELGLASPDSQQIAQRLIDAIADCAFEAARSEYEAQGIGLDEFLNGAEAVWSRPAELDIARFSQVQVRAVPCIATAFAQAGIPAPPNLGSAGNEFAERFSSGSAPPPPWASEMEARIREHVSSYPGLDLTRAIVTCRDEGCSVLMVGHDIRIFDLEFDQFAEQNGFRHAIIGGDRARRHVWLQR